MLGPKVRLKDATPKKLARALLRQPHLRPGAGGKPVVGYQFPIERVAAGKPRDRVPHLRKRSCRTLKLLRQPVHQ